MVLYDNDITVDLRVKCDKIHTQLTKLGYFVIFSQSKNKKNIGRTYSSIYVTSSENPIERVRLNSVFLF